MSRAFISILGTNDYLECRHKFNDSETDIPVKYCQEDLIKFFCSDFNKGDEIRIFLTKDAEIKNWLNDGHFDRRTNQPISNTGLKERLEKIVDPILIKPIGIKEGFNEDEIWEIFQTIFDSINEDEELIVDITHSFRSLPMLMISLLNFAKQVKNVKVKGVYYAAFETLGSIEEVKKMPVEERVAPILDLTAFSLLQDWTNATYDFVNYGNVKMLNNLVKHISNSSNITDPAQKYFPNRVIKKLNQLVDNIALCRGKELIEFDYNNLKNEIRQLYENKLPKPFSYLLKVITDRIDNFNQNPEALIIKVSQWCFDYNLIQQAITLLQEFTISLILKNHNLDISDKTNREIISQSFRIKAQDIPEDKWYEPAAGNVELVRKILSDYLLSNLSPSFNSLTSLRNDVNHAGFLLDAKSTESIKANIQQIIEHYKKYLYRNHAHQPIKSPEK
ncbi:TM1812 family CRISPR-associated protein [Ignavibacterium album JCM 16511]|uniref:TM1812 family CRISPR-associated protein n=1 Tax=Ignavibacterium album (strain DSM 19864 / JCM 16511 / NBRC 101810 / Mat9-16) TaxID=945713 RepID=I0AIV3_IGNAJ|nr:TIGR02221 family CRISPR-associated protein [Ignavibacterium album]AFH48910.1 TM1812 family CRISPR-associated protein [Ignavibacterium album JCM 16511]